MNKQWHCCHLAAHATFSAGLYFQTIAMCNKALAILATSRDMPPERRLTLYLLGSAYFALGQIDAAKKCYEEIATLPGHDSESEILTYHGRAICAQHSGNVEEAMAILHTLDADTRFPATAAHKARLEFLLFWAEQDPYSVDICLPLENYLAALLDSAPADKSYERVKTEWAIAKSQLRRAPKSSVLPVIQQHAELFTSLAHRGRAAEVLQFGATLMNRHGDCATAYRLMKEACELTRLAVR